MLTLVINIQINALKSHCVAFIKRILCLINDLQTLDFFNQHQAPVNLSSLPEYSCLLQRLNHLQQYLIVTKMVLVQYISYIFSRSDFLNKLVLI